MSETAEPVIGQQSDDSTTTSNMGRPTVYTPEMAAELFAYLSMGEPLRTACGHEGMPHVATVFRWLSASNQAEWGVDFREQYARAKEEAADAMAEEILYIADNQVVGEVIVTKPNKEGKLVTEVRKEDMLGHRRLQIDSRKWLASKLKPKRYGDKLDMTSGGDKLGVGLSAEQAQQLITARAARSDI